MYAYYLFWSNLESYKDAIIVQRSIVLCRPATLTGYVFVTHVMVYYQVKAVNFVGKITQNYTIAAVERH